MSPPEGYAETLIAVADDCPVTRSVVPTSRAGRRTTAVVQYEMIAAAPHALTQEDVLVETWLRRRGLPEDIGGAEREELRRRLFERPQACLRSSPLPKRYGWGLLFDRQGRVALCPMESERYRRIVAGGEGGIRVLRALRSRRAPDA